MLTVSSGIIRESASDRIREILNNVSHINSNTSRLYRPHPSNDMVEGSDIHFHGKCGVVYL